MSLRIKDYQIYPTIFPDNTSQVWKLPERIFEQSSVTVTWEFTHEGEFMQLAQLKSLLDIRGVGVSLYLPYLPYGRQDKEICNEQTFALHTFAQMLNYLNFEDVLIDDPHSPLALELIGRSRDAFPTALVERIYEFTQSDIVCYPDKGALDKYQYIYNYPFVYGEKDREQETGKILDYQFNGDVHGKTVLIIDDICDGGATFVCLAKALFERGATAVNLFVTHGIFSKGLQPLTNAKIYNVFTQAGEAVAVDSFTVGYKTI